MVDYSRYQFVKVEVKDKVATITLNRPDSLNAINPQMHTELEEAFRDVAGDEAVNAVILTGAGRLFCAGGDIRSMDSGAFGGRERFPMRGARRLIHHMLEVEQPIISALNGDAVGLGATLALFADIIIAAENARIGDPHVKVGLVAGDGGAVIWPLLVGIARAKELLMTGDLISAREAERIGLINKVVPKEQVYSAALELATRLANGPSRAIRWTKMSLNKRLRDEVNLVLEASLAMESLSQASEDHKEAARSFVEKRQPRFTGY